MVAKRNGSLPCMAAPGARNRPGSLHPVGVVSYGCSAGLGPRKGHRGSSPADSASNAKRAALEAIREAIPGVSATAQARRLLAALLAWSIDTFEASRFLDVYHPPARVLALRQQGHDIKTTWKQVPTECGRLHRVGVYTLMKGVQA